MENLKSEISKIFESKKDQKNQRILRQRNLNYFNIIISSIDGYIRIFEVLMGENLDEFDAYVSFVVNLEKYEAKNYLGENVFIKRNDKIEVNGQSKFSVYQFQIKDMPKVNQYNNEKPKL